MPHSSLGVLVGSALALALTACQDEKVSPAGPTSEPPGADATTDTGAPDEAGGVMIAANANFFVSSDTSKTGNLGGLAGADARCKRLAEAAALPPHTWHAYLSVEHDAPSGQPLDARDRIGTGPFVNVLGVGVAADVDALHARTGDAAVFVDEHGQKIPGQWAGSPSPVAHDVLTGSQGDGTLLPGATCADWTSDSAALKAQVGHTDGLGPGMNPAAPYSSWNSAHANGGCNDTAPLGGAGRIYCFGL